MSMKPSETFRQQWAKALAEQAKAKRRRAKRSPYDRAQPGVVRWPQVPECTRVPLSWDKMPATYIDFNGELRCRRCQRPVKDHQEEEMFDTDAHGNPLPDGAKENSPSPGTTKNTGAGGTHSTAPSSIPKGK